MGGQRLFISHASEDEAVTGRIVSYLEARGVPCWIAGRDIPPRAIYAEEITRGIHDSAACGVIISRSANESAAIKRELELASHYGKSFIPIRIDASEPGPGLDYYLRNTQWINYSRDGDRALDRIASHMQDVVPGTTTTTTTTRRPAATPTPPMGGDNTARAVIIAIAAGAVLGGLGMGWAVWNRNKADDPPPPPVTEVAGATTESDIAGELAAATAEAERLERERQQAATEGERARLQRELDRARQTAREAQTALEAERRAADARDRERASSSSSASYAGVWYGSQSGENAASPTIGWQLSSDGTACWSYNNYDFVSGCDVYTWSVSGNTITIQSDSDHWTGTVSGSTFSGSNTTYDVPFRLTRQ